jgi:translation initiation factor 2B subunit (eIF-2B alpha/beta/delta family)
VFFVLHCSSHCKLRLFRKAGLACTAICTAAMRRASSRISAKFLGPATILEN